MDDPGGVCCGKAVGHLHREVEEFPRCLDRRDGTAVHQFHDQILGVDVIELADVGMVARRNRARFAVEAVGKTLLREFDGDGAPESRVARRVNFAHAPGAERRQDLERAEPLTRR